jgi:hypothetical protein
MFYLLTWGQPTKQELKSLESDAIVFGNGTNRVYAFLDPMCSVSQHYLELISSNETFLKTNTYYIFLHRLEKFDSDELIDSIYMAHDRKKALIDNMLFGQKIELKFASEEVEELRNRIRIVANKTQMKQRPYILMYKLGDDICDVREGSAACMILK